MALKLTVSVGPDKFEVEGDFDLPDAVPALTQWGRLIGLAPGQAEVDELTQRLKSNNDALSTTVSTHQGE